MLLNLRIKHKLVIHRIHDVVRYNSESFISIGVLNEIDGKSFRHQNILIFFLKISLSWKFRVYTNILCMDIYRRKWGKVMERGKMIFRSTGFNIQMASYSIRHTVYNYIICINCNTYHHVHIMYR